MDELRKPPLGWGNDELSLFQEKAYQNAWATFANLSELRDLFIAIDKTYHTYVEQVNKGSIIHQENADISNFLLVLLSHSQLRATFGLASTGHVSAVFPAGRAALESALYSWYLTTYPQEAANWHDRPMERKDRKEWSKKFNFSPIAEKLKAVDACSSKRAKELHQQAIDFGSHPNSDGLYSNVSINETLQGCFIGVNYLHNHDLLFTRAAQFACEVGLVSLELVYLSNPTCEIKKHHSELIVQYKKVCDRNRDYIDKLT